jgi:hypothetical protein
MANNIRIHYLPGKGNLNNVINKGVVQSIQNDDRGWAILRRIGQMITTCHTTLFFQPNELHPLPIVNDLISQG